VFLATGIRLAEIAGVRHQPDDPYCSDVDLAAREITVRGKGGKPRTVKLSHEAARRLDRYLRARSGRELAWRSELWLREGTRGPLDRVRFHGTSPLAAWRRRAIRRYLRGVGVASLIHADRPNWAIWAGRCEAGMCDGDVATGAGSG
jgi:integrase